MKTVKMLIINLIIILISGCSPQADTKITDLKDEESSGIYIMENELEFLENYAENINDSSFIPAYEDGFIFMYENTPVYLGDFTENILEKFEPIDFYEYNSCSFEGMAKIYSYGEFDFSTYLNYKSEKDRIYSIDLFDAPTAEGIYIGHTFNDMITVYGTEYEELQAFARIYSYNKKGTVLSFGVEDDIIISISYQVENIYE